MLSLLTVLCRYATQPSWTRWLSLPSLMKYTPGLDFFNSHSHCRFAGEVSSLAGITVSLVQGSSFGPTSYIVNAADLRPEYDGNVITKFANDTYLISHAKNSHTRGEEVPHVKSNGLPTITSSSTAPSHTK